MVGMNRAAQFLVLFWLVATAGCRTAINYPNPAGPRYAGGTSGGQRGGWFAATGHLRLVTFNVHWGRHLDRAIELLRVAGAADGADIVALQEVDARQTKRVADALGMSFVYYPAVVHPVTGRDFGTAVLARWPIVEDWKVILPHPGRFLRTQRAATAATILVGDDSLRVYSVHLATMMEAGPTSRREQARAVVADAARFSRVVVAGDMNGVAVGEEFRACGFLWPTRDNEPTFHVFTWDHIFLRGLVVKDSLSIGVVDEDLGASDHRPVWAVARLLPPDRGNDHQTGPSRESRLEGCAALALRPDTATRT